MSGLTPNEEDAGMEEQRRRERENARRQIAERLVAARNELGLSAEDVAGSLRLLPEHMHAFDSGDWGEMPEEVYTLGFLRQYAQFVGLDLSDDIERLKSGDYRLSKPLTTPDPPVAPNRKWAITFAVLFMLLFIIFNLLNDNDENKAVSPQVTDTQVANTKAAGMNAADTRVTRVQTADIPAAGTNADISETQQQMPAIPPKTEKAPGQTEAPASIEAATQTAASIAAGMHHYRFTASGEAAWLQVFDTSHELIREALLQPGDSLRLDDDGSELFITCGNAAALQISVDDVVVNAAGTLGGFGEVLHDFRLTAPARP